MTSKELYKLFESVTVGHEYVLGLAGRYSKKVQRFKLYKILDKKKHSDYSYSLFCQGYDEGGTRGVIYHWIAPNYSSVFTETVVSIEPVKYEQ